MHNNVLSFLIIVESNSIQSKEMSLKQVIFFLSIISLAFLIPRKHYLIETVDDQPKQKGPSCVDEYEYEYWGGWVPQDDCNMCFCEDGKPPNCTQYDCDKKHPGCMDKAGNMYKHGEHFVPKGDCNTCMCDNGAIGACTRMGCLKN